MGKRNDHIVIPNAILKKFLKGNKNIFGLDLINNNIFPTFTNKIFTQNLYFDKDVDDFIKSKVETPIGKIYALASNHEINKIKYKKLKDIKNLYIIQYYRGNNISNNYIFRKTHNKNLRTLIEFLKNGKYSKDVSLSTLYEFQNIFYDTQLTPGILYINCNRSLILPASPVANIKFKNQIYYLVIIDPNIALIWKLGNKDDCQFYELNIDFEKDLEIINSEIINYEKKVNIDNKVFGLEDELKKSLIYNNKSLV